MLGGVDHLAKTQISWPLLMMTSLETNSYCQGSAGGAAVDIAIGHNPVGNYSMNK